MKTVAFLIFSLMALVLAGVAEPARAQQVQIVEPADGAPVYPGQTVMVTIEGSPGIETAMITVEKPLPPAKEVAPLQYSVEIPLDLPEGAYHIRAMSQVAGKFVESTPLTLNVAWPGKLVSAEPYPDAITFDSIGKNTQLKVLGTFENGAQADIARSQRSIYVSSDPNVATVSLDGVVTSLGNGKAKIILKNSGIIKTIPVTVAGSQGGRITYDLRMVADSPLGKGTGDSYYRAHINAGSYGNIPLAYVKILSVTLNDQPAHALPPEKLNAKMKDVWAFDLGFAVAAGASGTKATMHIKGVYSAVPEFYHHDQPFDSSFDVDLP
jgi:hypothetical protein